MPKIVNRKINIYIDQDSALSAQAKLQAAFDKSSQRVKKLQASGKDATKEIEKMAKLKGRLKEMDGIVSGKLRPSFNMVRKSVSKLRRELQRMSKDTPGYAAKFEKFKKANAQFKEMKKDIFGVRKAMQGLGSQLKTIATGVLIGNTIESAIRQIGSYVSGIIQGNARISDSIADVRRVTGLTAEEAKNLYRQLRRLDTRTSTSGLLNIAFIAGKLGLEGVDNITSFTDAVDKLQVVLGDELGDADQITTQLGKIINVFSETGEVTGDALKHVGNAVVELAHSGVSTGAFITDFAKRLTGLKGIAEVALPDILGLGAGLEETGQRVETASTAVIKLITHIGQDVPKAAEIAGRSAQEFTQILNDKPLEALLEYAEGLQKDKAGMAEISEAFKDAGENGVRVITTLGVLGSKADFFRKRMEKGNEAFADTNSLMDAFALKNETLGAQLDKLRKKFFNLITASGIKDFLTSAVHATSQFIDVLLSLGKFIKENTLALGLWTAAIVLNRTARLKNIASVIKEKIVTIASTAATKADIIATTALSAAKALLSGNIRKARMEFKLMSIAMGTNPLGLILIAAGALLIAFNKLKKSFSDLTAEQKIQMEIAKKVSDTTSEQTTKIKTLTDIVKDNSLALEVRKRALQQLIDINPDYLEGLTLNNIATKEGKKLLDDLTESIKENAAAEARRQLLVEKNKELQEAQYELQQKIKKQLGEDVTEEFAKAIVKGRKSLVGVGGVYDDLIKSFEKVEELDAQVRELGDTAQDDTAKKIKEKLKEESDAAKEAANTIGKMIKSLEGDLKKLQIDYNNLEVSDTKAREENLKKQQVIQDKIKELQGKAIESRAKASAKRLSSEEKLALKLKRINEDLNHYFDTEIDKRVYAIERKYKKEIELAKGNAELLKSIEETRAREISLLLRSYFRKTMEDIEKRTKDYGRKIKKSIRKSIQEGTSQVFGSSDLPDITPEGSTIDPEEFKGWIDNAQKTVDAFSYIYDSISQKENEELNRMEAIHQKKVDLLDKELRRKIISQEQYNRKRAKLDKEYDKKEKALKKEQFERNKKMQIAQALMSGAQAIVSTLAARPGPLDLVSLGTLRAVSVALTAATTAAQVLAISKTKAPNYGHGGKLDGPSHESSYKGMPVTDPRTGKVNAMMEGGEGILKKSAMQDKNHYTVSGTPSQIASSLNASHGGVHWETGATLAPKWQSAELPQINIPRLQKTMGTIRRYAAGGRFSTNDTSDNNKEDNSPMVVQGGFSPEQFEALMNAFNRKLKAEVSLTEINSQQERMNNIRQNTTMS